MLNIEKYKARLENYDKSLDCDIQKIREKCKGKNNFCGSKTCDECRKENMQWLLAEAEILDDAEKRYLKGVIRPFRKKVKHIVKINLCSSPEEQFIRIVIGNLDFINFPNFNKNTGMYKGMEVDKLYSLEELGLWHQ